MLVEGRQCCRVDDTARVTRHPARRFVLAEQGFGGAIGVRALAQPVQAVAQAVEQVRECGFVLPKDGQDMAAVPLGDVGSNLAELFPVAGGRKRRERRVIGQDRVKRFAQIEDVAFRQARHRLRRDLGRHAFEQGCDRLRRGLSDGVCRRVGSPCDNNRDVGHRQQADPDRIAARGRWRLGGTEADDDATAVVAVVG